MKGIDTFVLVTGCLNLLSMIVSFYRGRVDMELLNGVGVIICYMIICFNELKKTITEARNDG